MVKPTTSPIKAKSLKSATFLIVCIGVSVKAFIPFVLI